MHQARIPLIIALLLAILGSVICAASRFEHFITRQGDQFREGAREFRFISFNIPNLHYIEDHLPFDELNAWRLPNEFEITDALTAVRQMGGRVARTYTLSVHKADDPPNLPRHVLDPGRFNEEAFRALDKVLQVANETGIRIIIPFVDNWKWWGGIEQYAAFRGKKKEAFWTDPQLIADFKQTLRYVINRTNTYTGIKYKDDKAILAWETGNELQCPAAWTHEIAAYIKSLDRNHLVLDGYHTSNLKDESIADPAVDIVTTHHYPKNADQMIDQVRRNCARSRGKKPYVVGEFGFTPTPGIRRFLDQIIDTGVSGALIWSLRFRSRDGGFYWHSEPFGGDLYKAYHWPGFPSGDRYDEANLLKLMREKAFEIQGLSAPPLEISQPPILLPIEDVAALTWRGAAGATGYRVEHAEHPEGPWLTVGTDISDAAAPYRPLFNDNMVSIGRSYYYRVRAENQTGQSPPSNIVGPVPVKHLTLVDEMEDFSLIHHWGSISAEIQQARQFKEDFHRVKGQKASFLVYRFSAPILAWKMYAFFPKEVADFRFSVSADGKKYTEVPSAPQKYFNPGADDYGYWKPVLFQGRIKDKTAYFLKIQYATQAQISRLEITYGGSQTAMDPQLIEEFKAGARHELEQNILPFWLKLSRDESRGGFVGRITNDLKVMTDAPKGLVLNARILWTFSAAYRLTQNEEYLKMARRAYEYLVHHFWDAEHGGAYWLLDADGRPKDDMKNLYGQAFFIYALAEYYRATGETAAVELARRHFRLLEEKCHDPQHNGYFEMYHHDWTLSDRPAIGSNNPLEKKSMNAHLHLLEAFTTLYHIWRDDTLRQRLKEMIEVFRDHIIDSRTHHFKLFFDPTWRSHAETEVVSFGHDIEGSWLLTEAAEVLADPVLKKEVEHISLQMAHAVYVEGLDRDGGLLYEAEAGHITNAEKHWWPQAETIVGFINAWQLSGEMHYFEAARRCWRFTLEHIVDKQHGEWFWKYPRPAGASGDTFKASEWKTPYHNGRACLEIMLRLDKAH